MRTAAPFRASADLARHDVAAGVAKASHGPRYGLALLCRRHLAAPAFKSF